MKNQNKTNLSNCLSETKLHFSLAKVSEYKRRLRLQEEILESKVSGFFCCAQLLRNQALKGGAHLISVSKYKLTESEQE